MKAASSKSSDAKRGSSQLVGHCFSGYAAIDLEERLKLVWPGGFCPVCNANSDPAGWDEVFVDSVAQLSW
jgi:hypothetical protein